MMIFPLDVSSRAYTRAYHAIWTSAHGFKGPLLVILRDLKESEPITEKYTRKDTDSACL